MGKIHKLKCWIPYFGMVQRGEKEFELRVDDRDFQIGDTLLLEEYNQYNDEYTGNTCLRVIKYYLRNDKWLQPGVCALGLKSFISKDSIAKNFRKEFMYEKNGALFLKDEATPDVIINYFIRKIDES